MKIAFRAPLPENQPGCTTLTVDGQTIQIRPEHPWNPPASERAEPATIHEAVLAEGLQSRGQFNGEEGFAAEEHALFDSRKPRCRSQCPRTQTIAFRETLFGDCFSRFTRVRCNSRIGLRRFAEPGLAWERNLPNSGMLEAAFADKCETLHAGSDGIPRQISVVSSDE
jgi:hypothetical protein